MIVCRRRGGVLLLVALALADARHMFLRYVLRITSPPPCANMRFFAKSKKSL